MVENLFCESSYREEAVIIEGESLVIGRMEYRGKKLDLPALLENQHIYPKIYLQDRDTSVERTALASLISYDIPPHIESSDPHFIRFYGGKAFAEGHKQTSLWKGFPDHCFFLPLYEIIQTPEETRLFIYQINPTAQSSTDFELYLKRLKLMKKRLISPITVTSLIHQPEYPEWENKLESLITAIKEDKLQKAVAARKSMYTTELSVSPYYLLQCFQKHPTPLYFFSVQFTPSKTFIGASPEKLYKRSGNLLSSEALAGTRKRGINSENDECLAQELLHSSKDQKELKHVIHHIQECMNTLCIDISKSFETKILKTPSVQHLLYSIEGHLAPNISDKEILRALHPTPAICGTPSGVALDHILNLELFDRGWYAAPIGYHSQAETLFCVAIRSCLSHGKEIHVFTGCGIVDESTAEDEWKEINDKLAFFEKIME